MAKPDPVKFSLLLSLAVLCLLALASPAFAAVVPRTQSSDRAVDVMFTVYGGNTHYQIYRHQRNSSDPEYSDPDADYNVEFVKVGSVEVSLAAGDLDAIVTSSVVPGSGDSFTTVKPGLKYVVFHDRGDIVNWREYYYLITEGTSYKGYPNGTKPEDYVITAAFPPNQTRHGNYTEFTGACTGCHGLHSAQSKQKLLKGATVSDLCATCHDGSVSKYDVVKGKVMMEGGMYAPQPAGPFGTQLLDNITDGDDTARYRWASSVHNIYRSNPSVVWAQVYLAPGTGFRPGTNPPDSAKGSYGSTTDFSPVGWGSQLSCISCHEPHNKPLNFRLLRNDITDGATGDGDSGLKVRGLSETGTAVAGDIMWPQAYTDHDSIVGGYVYVSQTKFLSGTSRFCSQCHRAFFNKSIRVVDNRVLTTMFTKPGEGGYSSTEQANIRDFFLGLSALYATEVPTQSAVQTYVTANISKMNDGEGGVNCDLCHGIEAETMEVDGSASSVTVIESTQSKKIYIGWATGDRNLDRDAGAQVGPENDRSVMGSGHRHPTEVPAQRVRISGKVINRETLDTVGEKQAWIKPGPVNVGVPLEGTGSGEGTSGIGSFSDNTYPSNNVVCLTCHMAHGSRADVNTGGFPWSEWIGSSKLEVAYDNFSINNPGQTVGPGGIEQNPVSGYYRDTSTVPASGVNTVLARFAPMGRACFYCHSTRQ